MSALRRYYPRPLARLSANDFSAYPRTTRQPLLPLRDNNEGQIARIRRACRVCERRHCVRRAASTPLRHNTFRCHGFTTIRGASPDAPCSAQPHEGKALFYATPDQIIRTRCSWQARSSTATDLFCRSVVHSGATRPLSPVLTDNPLQGAATTRSSHLWCTPHQKVSLLMLRSFSVLADPLVLSWPCDHDRMPPTY